ncbi:MAG: hypothetical protein ABIY56_02105 [Dokdonella sp.]
MSRRTRSTRPLLGGACRNATFRSLLGHFAHASMLWLHAAFNATFVPFTWMQAPETNCIIFEQIELNLMSSRRLSDKRTSHLLWSHLNLICRAMTARI